MRSVEYTLDLFFYFFWTPTQHLMRLWRLSGTSQFCLADKNQSVKTTCNGCRRVGFRKRPVCDVINVQPKMRVTSGDRAVDIAFCRQVAFKHVTWTAKRKKNNKIGLCNKSELSIKSCSVNIAREGKVLSVTDSLFHTAADTSFHEDFICICCHVFTQMQRCATMLVQGKRSYWNHQTACGKCFVLVL